MLDEFMEKVINFYTKFYKRTSCEFRNTKKINLFYKKIVRATFQNSV